MSAEDKKYGDLEVLEGIKIPGQEIRGVDPDEWLFRRALIQEVKNLQGKAEDQDAHGFVTGLSRTLVKASLG